MDLDEFKNILQQLPEKSAKSDISDEAIKQLISSKATSSISKIKKSLWFEMKCGILFLLFAIYWLIYHPTFFIKIFASIIIIISLLFFVYFLFLNKKISSFQIAGSTIKQTLEQVIAIIENFTKHYFQLTVILITAILALSLLINVSMLYQNQTDLIQILTSGPVVRYLAFSILWCVLMYFFSKWYINLLYGKHLKKLKEQLKELENQQ